MSIPMKLLLLDPLNNEWGNGLVAINKMRGEMVDFPDDWEIGISDKTGTSAMQSFIIYKNEAYDIVKNYYDVDNKVRIFMCIKSREPYDNEELFNLQKPDKKDDTPSIPVTPEKPLLTRVSDSIGAGFRDAGKNNVSTLGDIAANALKHVYSTGTLNYAITIPNYRDETNKLIDWRKSVAEGEETQAVTYYDYNITQSINVITNSGMAYVVGERNYDVLGHGRTVNYINRLTSELKSYHKDTTFEVGCQAIEVNGTVYIGWVAEVHLPYVAKTKKDPLIDRAKANLAQAFTDLGKNNDETLSNNITQYLNTVTSDNKINMNIVVPSEEAEQAKLGKYMEAVENGEHADAYSITVYTLTEDLDLDTNIGKAYEVTEDTVTTLPYDKTKSFIAEQTESAASISEDYDITFAGSVVEVKNKVYIGWAITIDLPEVAKVVPPISEQVAPLMEKAFADAGEAKDSELSTMVDKVLATVDASGNINMNNVTPLEETEQAKFATWSEAVEAGEKAEACSMTIYTVTTDLDTSTNIGPAYEITQDTLESLASTKTKEFISEQKESATSINPGVTFAVGASVKEVNGKSYIGWAVKIGLPEVAAVEKPTEPETPSEGGNTDSSETDLDTDTSTDSADNDVSFPG